MARRLAFSLQELRNAARAAAEANVRAEWELLPDGARRISFTPITGATPQSDGITDDMIKGQSW